MQKRLINKTMICLKITGENLSVSFQLIRKLKLNNFLFFLYRKYNEYALETLIEALK